MTDKRKKKVKLEALVIMVLEETIKVSLKDEAINKNIYECVVPREVKQCYFRKRRLKWIIHILRHTHTGMLADVPEGITQGRRK